MSSTNRTNRFLKAGAAMFFLWGILHVYAGALLIAPFFQHGPGAVYGVPFGEEAVGPALKAASHIALNFGFDLAGYGVLAIWLSCLIWVGRHVKLSFWILVVMLAIADGAFIYSLLLPGYSPLLEGIVGPLLFGLFRRICG